MTIRKLPENNRRLDRIVTLIDRCVWMELRARYTHFDMSITSIHLSKDLRLARVNVYSTTQDSTKLLSILQDLRAPIQKNIASHNLRNTPVLSFFWDDDEELFRKLQKDIQEHYDTPPSAQ